jgi:hypothetical protein
LATVDRYREMPGPDTTLARLEEAYKGSEKRYDALFLYEELVWNAVTTKQKLMLLGFTDEQVGRVRV